MTIGRYQIHWQPGPEITFTAADLVKTHRIEPEIEVLAHRKVIAIAFTGSMSTIYKIVTAPETIHQIAKGLLKAQRIEGIRALGDIDMEVVFEDHTKMEFPFNFDEREKLIKGTTWESKDLYPLFRTVLKKYLGDSE